MKIRNGMAVALCVSAGVLGLTACSDSERSGTPGVSTAAAGAQAGGASQAAGACGDLSGKYPSLKGKTFNVGSSPGQHFYDYVDEKNPSDVVGLEPDIIKAVGQCAGFQVNYQKLDFNGLVPALAANRIDMITSGMYATSERAKQVNFVSYMKAAEAAVVPKGNPKGMKSLDDLCGATVAQVTGTVEVEIAAKKDKECQAAGKPAMKFLNFSQQTQLTQALSQNRADVFLTDSGVAAYLSKQFATSLETAFPIVSDFKFGVAVNKSGTDLLKALEEGLGKLYTSGELAKIATKWGFSESQVVQPQAVTS
jgi:polar amino acid transport system substrate-binding protein